MSLFYISFPQSTSGRLFGPNGKLEGNAHVVVLELDQIFLHTATDNKALLCQFKQSEMSHTISIVNFTSAIPVMICNVGSCFCLFFFFYHDKKSGLDLKV